MTLPYEMYPDSPPPHKPLSSKQKWWIRIGIVGGSLLLIGLIAFAVNGVQSLLHRSSGASGLATGAPGPTTAVAPIDCVGQCFSEKVVGELIPANATLTAVGAPSVYFPPGTYDPTTAGSEYRAGLADWRANSGSPDNCFFATANAPVDDTITDGEDQLTDPVDFVGTWSDSSHLNVVDVSSRVFPNTPAASAYLGYLASNIRRCNRAEFGVGARRFAVTFQPEPALTVPDSIASTGWVRLGTGSNTTRVYVTDLQRGNLVVRIRALTAGGISETHYRSFVATFAQTQLAGLTLEAPVG